MASIIPGYEYDIFISYRQKDNKGEKWVSRFVEALKIDLEASFKEDIRIYFDENPHDRLQDSHDVNKSLEGKLKCLIFIPILSQTYCDPDSYAWKNELLAFNKVAANDSFGKNIRLKNGNYTSRILQIRIHDLEPDDIKLFEKETGSALRSMDFVFKTSTGVNRPLKPNEDHPLDNLNKTFYSDQINRVANAIKEIIAALKSDPESKLTGESRIQSGPIHTEISTGGTDRSRIIHKSLTKWLIISFALIICITGAYFVFKRTHNKVSGNISEREKSIAVLPFANDSPDKENEYFCNGMMEEILHQLQKISDLRVKARTSVEKYRNPDKDIKVIGQELGVSLIIEGSVRKIGDDLRITAQLIDTKTGDHLWSETYDGKYTMAIFDFQSTIARKVAASLNVVISSKESNRLDKKPTTEIAAHDLALKGGEMTGKFISTGDNNYARLALNLFNRALETDPKNTNAIGGKAQLFRFLGYTNYDSSRFYSEKLIKIDPENSGGWAGMGAIYLFEYKVDSGLYYIQKAIDLAPGDMDLNEFMGEALSLYKNNVPEGLLYFQKSYDLGGNVVPYINQYIARAFFQIGDYNKALKYTKIALSLSPECVFISDYDYILMVEGKYNEANHFLDSICGITLCEKTCDILRYYLYTNQKEFEKAEKLYNKAVSTGNKKIENYDCYLAWIYKETGRENKARQILNKSIKRDKDLLKGPDAFLKYSTLRLAAAYSLLGDTKNALKYLSELKKIGYGEWPCPIRTFPGFDNLRSNSEFQSIIQYIEDQRAEARQMVREMEQSGELHL